MKFSSFFKNQTMEDGSFGKKNEINSSTSAGMLGTDLTYLREAARMFESTGKFEFAASCYYNLGDFEKAANIYLNECVKIDSAAECFTLAGCYSKAAEVYAKESQFSNCLSVCKKGKLFDKGLQYIKYWKESVHVISDEMENIEQDFLVSGATNFHEHKDLESMMTFVRSFCTMEPKRVFLRSLGCLDDLLVLLEEESGHFIEAAELARSSGDILREVDFLEMAGNFKEAALVLLWYVFFSSLWGDGNQGWPLKLFDQIEELCNKTKSLGKMDTDVFYDYVCSELKVLSNEYNSLPELKKDLHAYQIHGSLRGEILSVRKILDAHFRINLSKYNWEDELPFDISKHCEDNISFNRVSVRTLVYYWNLWKENVLIIFQSLANVEDPSIHEHHFDFTLNYFGVRKDCVKGNLVFLLVNKDADWIKNAGHEGLHRDGERCTMDIRDLVLAMRSYWQLELVSVGIKVLEILKGLLNESKLNGSLFHQSTSLLHMFEVSKFLLDCKYLNHTDAYRNKLQSFLEISLTYFDIVFPLDWRKSVSVDLVSVRETDLSRDLLDEIILQNVSIKGDLTFLEIGRVMMICLSSRKPFALYEIIIKGLQQSCSWTSFFEKLWNSRLWNSRLRYVSLVEALHDAMEDTYRSMSNPYRSTSNRNKVNRHKTPPDYIYLHSFVHILDRLLFMASFSSSIFFTKKSSFLGWFENILSNDHTPLTYAMVELPYVKFERILMFLIKVIQRILLNKEDTKSWILGSDIDVTHYHPLLALRLVMMLSLLCLKVPLHCKLLLDLLTGRDNIGDLLPKKFVSKLEMNRTGSDLNLNPEVVAKAFKSIGDPLLIVNVFSEKSITRIVAPGAIFVDISNTKNDIMSLLFPVNNKHCDCTCSADVGAGNTIPHSLEEIYEAINGKKEEGETLKKEVDKSIRTLATKLEEANRVLDELKLLSSAFDMSGHRVEQPVVTSGGIDIDQAVLESEKQGEDHQEENHVEHSDDSFVEVVLEKQSGGDNDQDA